MAIHGDPSLDRPAVGQVFHTIGGIKVEVFETPFCDETRALANECFDRFYRQHKFDLQSDIPAADYHAQKLIRVCFPQAIRQAERDCNEALATHFRDLIAEFGREPAYGWLSCLALEGAGRRPAAAIGDVGIEAVEVERAA